MISNAVGPKCKGPLLPHEISIIRVDCNPIDEQEDFDYVVPEWVMSKDEFRSAKSLQKGIKTRRKKQQELCDQKAKNYESKVEKLSSEIANHDATIDSLCEVVLKRELGLERYMVLRVVRSNAYQTTLQVLGFGLSEFWNTRRLAWQLTGRALRKDGTLGAKREYATFDAARIERRKLDGTWERLILRDVDDESASE